MNDKHSTKKYRTSAIYVTLFILASILCFICALRIKELRRIKLPSKMGWALLPSAKTSPVRLTIVRISTVMNGAEVQPKFCPKDGMHRSRLKKTRISAAPEISKFPSGF